MMLNTDLVQIVLESGPDAIVISDATGEVVLVNRQADTIFGYERSEVLGQPIEQLLPATRPPTHLDGAASGAAEHPAPVGIERQGRRKDGTEFPVDISLSPIQFGDRVLTATAIRDATQRKRIETELQQARNEAEHANAAKSRFLATASHDLRQPLQTLALLNGTLQRMTADPELRVVLAHEEQAIHSMSRLVNALLDISKLESGAIQPEVTDFTVASLFRELGLEFASLASSKGLALTVESGEDFVRSDPSLVEQILRNLISNAIKYTHSGRIAIRGVRVATVVRIEVLDTGIGIPADKLPYIFDEFYQVGVASNHARDGYGLGLSIVSRLVKLLGLKLDVLSVPGQGSIFSLELPQSSTDASVASA